MDRNSTGWIRFRAKDKEHDMAPNPLEADGIYKEILEILPDHVIKLDTALNVLWANGVARKVTEEPYGQKCHMAFIGQVEQCDNCPCVKAIESGVTEKSCIAFNKDDGEEIFWEVIAVPQLNELGEVVSVVEISREVTERVNSHRQMHAISEHINETMVAFKEEEQKRCNFILNLSSEVKSGLEDMSEQLHIIRHQTDSKEADWIEPLTQTSEKLLRKVANVNEFFGMEDTGVQLMYVPFELNELVDEIYNRFKNSARERGTSLEVNLSAGVPQKLIGDVFRLQTILLNVVENSVANTQNGKIRVSFYAQTSAEGKQTRMQIVITDTGVGLTEERLEQIQSMLQGEGPKDYFDQAIVMQGLGLLTASNLLNAMNGHIEIESQYGRGTVAKLYLDLGVKSAKTDLSKIQPIKEEDMPVEQSHGVKKKILIAEDEIVSRVSYKIHLQNHYELFFARTGKEAVDLFLSLKPDLVFMNIMLPEMNGLQAFEEMEKYGRRKVPMIACTTKVIEAERDYLISYGFTDYLPKPIEAVGINRIIGKYLNDGPEKI